MDRTIAINVSHLCKTYDSHKAVDDLSFQVYAGEIFGLLEPNGAGEEHHPPHPNHVAAPRHRARRP